jgi:hypothetical protein
VHYSKKGAVQAAPFVIQRLMRSEIHAAANRSRLLPTFDHFKKSVAA